MTDRSKISQLIIKQLDQELSVEEQVLLDQWVRESPANRELLQHFEDMEWVRENVDALLNMNHTRMSKKMQAALDRQHRAERYARLRRIWDPAFFSRVSGAAILIPMLICGALIILYSAYVSWHPDGHDRPNGQVLVAGQTLYASLKNADGKMVRLDTIPVNGWIKEDGWIIRKLGADTIVYERNEGGFHDECYHTLSIPYAQSWKVALPDGSKVQLNAGSTLAYNVQTSYKDILFAALNGEAFFEIKPDKSRLYSVHTPSRSIEVLGTSFDLCDYAEDLEIQAVLTDGAIRICGIWNNTIMRPGETVRIDKKKDVVQRGKFFDSSSLSWRLPYFEFTGSIQKTLPQIVRWYGLSGYRVDTTGIIKSIPSRAGRLGKVLTLTELMKSMETDDFHLHLDGKTLVFSGKK